MSRKVVRDLFLGAILTFALQAGQAVMAQTKGADAKAGEVKFRQLCATCHGSTGKGNGPAATGLNPKPKDLSVTKRTDTELKKIIKEGGASDGLSPLMPPWGSALSDQDIDNVIAYIRSLGKRVEK